MSYSLHSIIIVTINWFYNVKMMHCVDNQCLLHGTMTQHSSMSPPVVGLTPCHDAMMSFFIAFPIITIIIFIIIIITNLIADTNSLSHLQSKSPGWKIGPCGHFDFSQCDVYVVEIPTIKKTTQNKNLPEREFEKSFPGAHFAFSSPERRRWPKSWQSRLLPPHPTMSSHVQHADWISDPGYRSRPRI